VQLGIGGWQCPRPGVRQGRNMRTTILTIDDIARIGIDKTVEIALEVAWKGASAVFLSLDIDCVDAGFVPGTGWPEPGGFLPREMLGIIKGVAKEGVVGMEVVEVSPPYDISDITALLAVRSIVDVLAVMVQNDRIGGRLQSP
jgi:agmatinase